MGIIEPARIANGSATALKAGIPRKEDASPVHATPAPEHPGWPQAPDDRRLELSPESQWLSGRLRLPLGACPVSKLPPSRNCGRAVFEHFVPAQLSNDYFDEGICEPRTNRIPTQNTQHCVCGPIMQAPLRPAPNVVPGTTNIQASSQQTRGRRRS